MNLCAGCRDLRTNLPREVMGYSDAPFTPAYMGSASSDPRRYPGHAEVGGRGLPAVCMHNTACTLDSIWGTDFSVHPATLCYITQCQP